MIITSFNELFTTMLSEDSKRSHRVAQIAEKQRCNLAVATIIDDAFIEATRKAALSVAETLDGLSEDIRMAAVPYVMRGVVSNLDALENYLVAEMLIIALEEGVPIESTGKPDCPCATCTATREAIAAQRGSSGRLH